MRLLFYILLIYLLYKLIFDFVLPVSRATRQVRQHMKNMQENQPSSPPPPYSTTTQETKNNVPEGEYIDFEEIRQSPVR